ncbi:MAG: aspartate carbamoyltransferase catalytic subunit [Bdellovibrionales bacterium]|nr:aspartate carbamoyltransferase catalytic subunit [Bdellovibrionales bacterium]
MTKAMGGDYCLFLMTSFDSSFPPSFLTTADLSISQISELFKTAGSIKSHFQKHQQFPRLFTNNPVIALLFFEASTRTRLSFEMAINRLGGTCTFFDGASKEGSSLIKGETLDDTFWTVHSMMPNAMVVRCGDDFNLLSASQKTEMPIVNAGFGTHSHPTQALLDIFTMLEFLPSLEGKHVLFIGDISHSRVAMSHMELLPRLKAKVGVVGPKEFTSSVLSNKTEGSAEITTFENLKDALPWADVVIGLRIQFERHGSKEGFSLETYTQHYQIQKRHGSLLKKEALLFHPGPVNWGVEFLPDVRELPHFKMWQQKQNGVFVRAALLQSLLGKGKMS